MGEEKVKFVDQAEEQEEVLKEILRDINALEIMIENEQIDKKTQRIGVEQELFLINKAYQPDSKAIEFLKDFDDPRFTTELANFNLEINIDPRELKGACFSDLYTELKEALSKAKQRAGEIGSGIALTGILPTVGISDLGLDNLTPQSRPRAMIEGMDMLRDKEYPIRINGIDELVTSNFSNMFEGCNTSFQLHFQSSPDKIKNDYNFAQLIAAPVLAVSTNSPLLFGKRLWHETRIAMFQQAVETRNTSRHVVQEDIRAPFGTDWLQDSVPDFFRKDTSDYAIFLKNLKSSHSLEELKKGKVPKLRALDVFNSSIFRWNRICYGVTEGKPHLRIENRLLPAGPTIIDEVANAAFWLGLMNEVPEKYKALPDKMKFDDVRINLLKAARYGINNQLTWLDGDKVNAGELILEELLPVARNGLKKAGVNQDDIDKFLGIIENRASNLQTGSQWMLDEFAKMQNGEPSNVRAAFITVNLVNRQFEDSPVHEWGEADELTMEEVQNIYSNVGGIMTTDIYTVREDDLIDRVSNKLFKNGYRQIPVTDDKGRLKGLLQLIDIYYHYFNKVVGDTDSKVVADIMESDPRTISPDAPLKKAVDTLKEHKLKSLAVVKGNKLVGIVTQYDIMNFTSYILK